VERSDVKLAVTDSWNRAFSMARGDYVIMLGDDDSLCPGFFARALEVIRKFDHPDAIFSSLLQFFHPGAHPAFPEGRTILLPTANFFEYRDAPFILPQEERRRQVDNSLFFRRSFHFNMPAFTAKRTFLQSIAQDGALLQPPFPDYYFANLVFEKADRLVADPRPNAFQGVSRKSFGFTLLNQATEKGFEVLGHQTEKDEMYKSVGRFILPGNEYRAQYLLTMQRMAQTTGEASRRPDVKRYRKIEVLSQIRSARFAPLWMRSPAGRSIFRRLSLGEKAWSTGVAMLHLLGALFPKIFKNRLERLAHRLDFYSFHPFTPVIDDGNFIDGRQLFDALARAKIQIPRM
jgi:hypothetical protein